VSTLISQQLTQCQRKVARRIRHDHQPSAQLVWRRPISIMSSRSVFTVWLGAGSGPFIYSPVGGIGWTPLIALAPVEGSFAYQNPTMCWLPYNLLADAPVSRIWISLRVNEAFLDALGQAYPDPTTAGDFCRVLPSRTWRPSGHVQYHPGQTLATAAQGLPAAGHFRCRRHSGPHHRGVQAGMDIAYDAPGLSPSGGLAGQHQRALFLVNRPGNRPSHEGRGLLR